MSWFYGSETASRRDFDAASLARMNPNTMWAKHYDNFLFLDFMARNGTFVERHQAQKEIEIAKRKMKFWKHRPTFSVEVARAYQEKANKMWQNTEMSRLRS